MIASPLQAGRQLAQDMRSNSRFWMISVAFATLGVVIWIMSRTMAQPSYQGHSLSFWIEELPGAKHPNRGITWGSMEGEGNYDAPNAVRAIGTNALPYLASELNAPDGWREELHAAGDWIKQTWQRRITRNQTFVRNTGKNEKTSGQMRHWKAAVAIHALGPAAKPLIPRLVTMLNSRGNGEDCACAAYALSGMGPDGLKQLMPLLTKTNSPLGFDWAQLCVVWAMGQSPEAGRQAIPQLLPLLQNKDSAMRMGTAWTLGEVRTNEEVIVPALASQLSDKGFNVRSMTEGALKKYGISELTRPALKHDLTNSQPYIRMAATNAYIALYPEEAAQLGLK